MTRQTKAQKKEQAEIIEKLRGMLAPGTTVSTQLAHVSRSGMRRLIKVFVVAEGEITNISHLVATALDWRMKDGAIVADGAGMDMGYHLVHCLSYALHGMNSVGPDAIEASSLGRPFKPTREQFRAGYSLEHRWI